MDCGVPFCQADDGLPRIDNLIPEWNDLVYQGRWREALEIVCTRPTTSPNSPGRVCPAPCEGSCVLGITDPPVTIKNIEMAIIDRGFEEGWVVASPPAARTGRSVAVVGFGAGGSSPPRRSSIRRAIGSPSTSARDTDRRAADVRHPQHEARQGHRAAGALTCCARRAWSSSPGRRSVTGSGESADVGRLRDDSDALLLATGATVPARPSHRRPRTPRRALRHGVPHRQHQGAARHGSAPALCAEGQGRHRHRRRRHRDGLHRNLAAPVLPEPDQLRAVPEAAGRARAPDNPWPTWPRIFRVDYGHEEGARKFGHDPRVYSNLLEVVHRRAPTGRSPESAPRKSSSKMAASRRSPAPSASGRRTWCCCRWGSLGPEHEVSDPLAIEYDGRSNYAAEYGRYMTSANGVFAAGDCRRGQSLVVRAINEGREAAREIDRYLMGSTRLP